MQQQETKKKKKKNQKMQQQETKKKKKKNQKMQQQETKKKKNQKMQQQETKKKKKKKNNGETILCLPLLLSLPSPKSITKRGGNSWSQVGAQAVINLIIPHNMLAGL